MKWIATKKTIFTPKKNPSQTKSDRIESKSKAKIDQKYTLSKKLTKNPINMKVPIVIYGVQTKIVAQKNSFEEK